jgi:inorganic pyrophosphatase
MAKAKSGARSQSLGNPARLSPFEKEDADHVIVVIETPKGSRNKYAFDPEERIFSLKKVLPAGMTFPYDFGFIPSTIAGDEDPLDALVLMDEPAFPGCRLKCRIVGVIEGEQEEDGKKERNDRVLCVEARNHSFTHVRRVEDLGKEFEQELEQFFVNYHELSGSKYRVLAMKGPAQGRRCVKAAAKAARNGGARHK